VIVRAFGRDPGRGDRGRRGRGGSRPGHAGPRAWRTGSCAVCATWPKCAHQGVITAGSRKRGSRVARGRRARARADRPLPLLMRIVDRFDGGPSGLSTLAVALARSRTRSRTSTSRTCAARVHPAHAARAGRDEARTQSGRAKREVLLGLGRDVGGTCARASQRHDISELRFEDHRTRRERITQSPPQASIARRRR
jgi:hypothetical protein